jgi:flagellar basal-body rod protein FlgC
MTTRHGIVLLMVFILGGCTSQRGARLFVVGSSGREMVEHLRTFGAQPTSDGDGVVTLDNTPASRTALCRFLKFQMARMDVGGENIANEQTVLDADGKVNPYRRKYVALAKDGTVQVKTDTSSFRRRYDPGAPTAGADGYVLLPNVDVTQETVELIAARRDFATGAELLRRLDPEIVVHPVFSGAIEMPRR